MKKIIALAVAFVMLTVAMPMLSLANSTCSVWDGVSVTSNWASDYNSDWHVSQTFEINNAADFMAFRNKVLAEKENNPFYAKTVNLNCDIDLNNYNLRYGVGAWTDLTGAWYNKGYFFRGTFNGNGHIIKNITMDQTKPDALLGTSDVNAAVGFFTADAANINKLGIENIKVILPSNSSASCYYGGLASISYRTTISDCFVRNASFKGGWTDASNLTLGGISGYHRNNPMKNTYIDGLDLSGLNSGMMGRTFIGGLACSGDFSTKIEKCYSANVTKSTSTQGRYDNAVFILNSQNNGSSFTITLNDIYTDNPRHQAEGSLGNTGLLSTVLANVSSTLGSGFKYMKDYGLNPILTWEPLPTKKVTFVGDYEGSVDVIVSQDAELPTPPTGYHYEYKVGDKVWTGKGITQDVTVTVTKLINQYKITYVGDYTGTDYVNHGCDAILPVHPISTVKYKFTVNGNPWDGKNITADVTVTVTEITNACIITYIGDYTGDVAVEKGSDVNLPSASDEGYHYEFSVAGEEWDGKNIQGDVTVTVTKKINEYTISYIGDYVDTDSVEHGQNAVLPTAPTGYEYVFIVSGNQWDGKNVTEDITVNVKLAHIVEYVGDYEDKVVVIHGEDVERPSADEGYHFEFTYNSQKWIGENITKNITVVVKKVSDSMNSESNCSVWDGVSVTADWGNDYDTKDNFEINSAADFMAFRNMVSIDGCTFSQKMVNLNCDIDLNNFNLRYGVGAWTNELTGNWWQVVSFFYGVFNGNGHIIKNITMDQTKPDKLLGTSLENGTVGLFTARGASIKELGVENVTIVLPTSTKASGYYAGFASISYLTDITSCFAKNIKFKGGWSSATQARIAGLSAYHREKDLKCSYTSGIDFTGLNSALVPKSFIAGLVCSGDANTNIVNCYSSNIKKNTQNGNYDSSVYVLNPGNSADKIKLSNVFAEKIEHTGEGTTNSGATGTLSDALNNFDESFGKEFNNLSEYQLPPILKWENIDEPFTYSSINFYKNYGSQNQKKLDYLDKNNGNITIVVKDLSNNTGVDINNAVLSAAYINNKNATAISSKLVSIPNMNKIDEVVLNIDLSGITVSENGFIQITAYKGINLVVPIISSKRITK